MTLTLTLKLTLTLVLTLALALTHILPSRSDPDPKDESTKARYKDEKQFKKPIISANCFVPLKSKN
jgi:hypothetical protein